MKYRFRVYRNFQGGERLREESFFDTYGDAEMYRKAICKHGMVTERVEVRGESKSRFSIELITKAQCAEVLLRYHYLKDISKGFKSGVNHGLFLEGELVGVIIYTGFPVPELVKGMFGLERTDQKGFFELSRLCIEPTIQRVEHNLASSLSVCVSLSL